MSARKILWFIVSCIALLGVLAYYFPSQGWSLGSLRFRFPSLIEVLEGNKKEEDTHAISPEEQLQKMSEVFYLKNLSQLADSLDYYHHFFTESTVRIQFPENNPSLFDAFFSSMDQATQQHQLVRVLHYGDSQIEQDRITGSLRNTWQQQFGGRGLGLIPAIQIIPSPYITQEYQGDWQRKVVYGRPEMKATHTRYGPMGQVCELSDTGMISITARNLNRVPNFKKYTQIRLLLGHHTAGFRAILESQGQQWEQSLSDSIAGLRVLTWHFASPISDFNIYFSGSAEIYGLLLDGNQGVAVDNVPMRGCSGTIFTRMDANLLRQSYKAMNVKLFIMEFGGNRMPSIQNETDIDKYAKSIGRQIRYLKSLAPSAEVLFIGPADMSCMVDGERSSYPLLEKTVTALRNVCLENSAAFWDMYRVMGGHNSMLEWVKTQPPMAASDYIHFTYKGSQRISELLNKSLSVCYDYYHFRKHHLNDSILLEIDSLDRSTDYTQQMYEMIKGMAADSIHYEAIIEQLMQEELR